MGSSNAPKEALSPLRICDFSGQLAGAGATKILGAFGAQVVRVEDNVRQGQWDIFRGNGPYIDERRGNELGGMFNNHNVEKLGVTANMREAEGKEIVSDIISVSDVVTENFSAGVLRRWGLHYEDLVKIKPDIIYVSNCGFGHEGPSSHFKTWGPVVQAVSGLTFQSGFPDMPPAGWGYSYMNHTGGYFMAMAILMAVYHRNRTGEGQWVDMSCTDAAAALNGPEILDYTVNGRPARREGKPYSNRSDSPPMAPHGIYRSEGDDNWVAISARDDKDWSALCAVIGQEDLTKDERFSSLDARMKHQDALDSIVEEWTKARSHFDAMDTLQKAGVPAGAVQRPEDRIDHDDNVLDWKLFPEVTHPEIGTVRVDGMAMKLSESATPISEPAPLLGQHNRMVYGEILGLTDSQIDSFLEQGVI